MLQCCFVGAMLLQASWCLDPEQEFTLEGNFLQVAAGGSCKGVVDKQTVKNFAPGPGVYVMCVRPPGAGRREWTPGYLGKSDHVGTRWADYVDGVSYRFLGDKNCPDKRSMYEELADRCFDVALL